MTQDHVFIQSINTCLEDLDDMRIFLVRALRFLMRQLDEYRQNPDFDDELIKEIKDLCEGIEFDNYIQIRNDVNILDAIDLLVPDDFL